VGTTVIVLLVSLPLGDEDDVVVAGMGVLVVAELRHWSFGPFILFAAKRTPLVANNINVVPPSFP
jgi:energy-converting hydrogenase Eha subunit H